MFERRHLHALPVALLALVLAACQTPPRTSFPELTYSHLEPIRLAAAEIEVKDAYVPPLRAPNVEHQMPVAPAAAATRWARDRLQPGGPEGRAVFTIVDAGVVETKLKGSDGLEGVFTTDQSERYDATLAIEIDIYDRAGVRLGGVTSTVKRSRTVAENASLAERDQVWFSLTEAMMTDLDREVEAAIRKHLKLYLR